MRGNHVDQVSGRQQSGSIPAYAGEPVITPIPVSRCRVYPRVCGGTSEHEASLMPSRGLSPRMRGNLGMAVGGEDYCGSIPAYAGEPARMTAVLAPRGVYPRVCGGTTSDSPAIRNPIGLSPRMRGNPGAPSRGGALLWSIPAYAGEPGTALPNGGGLWVYPRVCGGTRT